MRDLTNSHRPVCFTPSCYSLRDILVGICCALLVHVASPQAVLAQAPLFYAGQETTVREISFKFVDTHTLETEDLVAQMATTQPSFFDKVKRILPIISPRTHRFDPVTLQKDVVRLRRYYRRHGFLHADVDYPASQLDTTRNTIHIVFSITEGPPLILQDFGFFDVDGNYAHDVFPPAFRQRWVVFRDRVSLQVGQRFTDAERLRLQDRVVTWMKDVGFAFATVSAQTNIDSTANTADVRFIVDPGPVGRFAEIQIEGNESVSRRVLERELPFQVGDRYSHRKVTQGQREIFGLNLFRVALADVPDQPVDSTVTIRYRVREAKARFLTGQTGYSRDDGVALQAEWRHRNFFGSARNFSVSATAATGFLASNTEQNLAKRRFGTALSISQPYLFSRWVSGSLSPFLQFERDQNLRESNEPLGINRRDFGLNTTIVYQPLPFRPYTVSYTFIRSLQFTTARESVDMEERDIFSKSVLSISGSIGRLNDYLNPRRGYLIQPYVESAGSVLGSGVEYVKLGTEARLFLPITRRISIGSRVQVGRLWPLGKSRELLDADDPIFEDRFDPILFYAGGATDVRGWDTGLLGAKVARPASVGSETIVYEAVGGRAKLAFNIEVRYPFPGLSSNWRLATFIDGGQVSGRERMLPDGGTQITDNGNLSLSSFRYAVGSGIRYRTPVGFLRFDLAFKLSPSARDLLSPKDAFEGNLDNEKFGRRFNIHLSIGQTF